MVPEVRYSNADLTEFKSRIEKKLEHARDDYEFVVSQIADQTEKIENACNQRGHSPYKTELESFKIMANRRRKHIEDLEKALIRVANKTYGICQLTGELIDKRRLMAVPSTTKSLAAKLEEIPPSKEKNE